LATGVVPSGFKAGKISPVYKGGNKSRHDPTLYWPVSILPAMSKVLEVLVKSDLEKHLAATNVLPLTQFGFHQRRGCSTALGTAHTGWIKSRGKSNVVGVMGYDLSSAFDTVAAEQLLPKLQLLGIRGRELSWFVLYISGGRQCVVWNGKDSTFVVVKYRVRQGSILGPVLFLVLMADLPACLHVGEDGNILYADDINTWAAAATVEEVASILTTRAARMTRFASKKGLALNASKTQLMYTKGVGVPVVVDSVGIIPGDTVELLGVTFDQTLTTRPHDKHVEDTARLCSSLVARLGHHLPQGRYLRQSATGLLLGKISHALPAVAAPCLVAEEKKKGTYRSVQTAVNDVARTITGHHREDHVTQ
jgi:hypothetical protein